MGMKSKKLVLSLSTLTYTHIQPIHIHLTSRSNYLSTHCTQLLLLFIFFLFITSNQPCSIQTTEMCELRLYNFFLFVSVLSAMLPMIFFITTIELHVWVWVCFRHLCLLFVHDVLPHSWWWSLVITCATCATTTRDRDCIDVLFFSISAFVACSLFAFKIRAFQINIGIHTKYVKDDAIISFWY